MYVPDIWRCCANVQQHPMLIFDKTKIILHLVNVLKRERGGGVSSKIPSTRFTSRIAGHVYILWHCLSASGTFFPNKSDREYPPNIVKAKVPLHWGFRILTATQPTSLFYHTPGVLHVFFGPRKSEQNFFKWNASFLLVVPVHIFQFDQSLISVNGLPTGSQYDSDSEFFNKHCLCDSGWTGELCDISLIYPCGTNGEEIRGQCACRKDFFGERCQYVTKCTHGQLYNGRYANWRNIILTIRFLLENNLLSVVSKYITIRKKIVWLSSKKSLGVRNFIIGPNKLVECRKKNIARIAFLAKNNLIFLTINI